ncbi:Wzz/FepE/Etk N-terminal domain-containing protein [Parafilimonas terrae]|uniref:Chain length determinant protein n=1 Tax=Parafilimonas terrae TaxID=1465490 RepID=A0A1I5X3I2_9BACT|nr:Wzz/FepE/Etk N-terminal domain-containing protein [Parafilimonas terrae]SFQ26386.1 Chain length determinant protein [Parafilimonas terrae]
MLDKESVSFRDIINQIITTVKYLFSKWLLIGIIAIAGAAIGITYAITSTPTYSATLNFVLSSPTASSNGLMGLASQFGLNLGTDNNNVFSGDNIIALMQSRRMVQKALFLKPENASKPLLDIYIKNKNLDEVWQQNERTKGAYPYPDDPAKMTGIQDSLFKIIYNDIQENMLDVSKPDNSQSIYQITTTSPNDTLSYYLTKYLVDATSSFYIDTKTSVAKQNLDMLMKEADSLKIILGGTITSAASQTDLTFNLNPAYQVQRSPAQQSQVSASALGQAYGQVLQNLELAKIALQKETPLYQIIDEPTLPLSTDKPSKLISIIVGGFLGGFLACCYLIAAKAYKIFKSA